MIGLVEIIFHIFMGHSVESSVPLVPFTQIQKVEYIAYMMIIIRISYPVIHRLIIKLKGVFNLW